jgi:hypothetical protein
MQGPPTPSSSEVRETPYSRTWARKLRGRYTRRVSATGETLAPRQTLYRWTNVSSARVESLRINPVEPAWTARKNISSSSKLVRCLTSPAKGGSPGSGVRAESPAETSCPGEGKGEARPSRETNKELHPSPRPGDVHDTTRCRSCAASILVASSRRNRRITQRNQFPRRIVLFRQWNIRLVIDDRQHLSAEHSSDDQALTLDRKHSVLFVEHILPSLFHNRIGCAILLPGSTRRSLSLVRVDCLVEVNPEHPRHHRKEGRQGQEQQHASNHGFLKRPAHRGP